VIASVQKRDVPIEPGWIGLRVTLSVPLRFFPPKIEKTLIVFLRLLVLSAQLATAAWSPNPKSPPLFLDLPTKNGEVQEGVIAKRAANAPLAFVDQYIGNLRQYRGTAIEVGDEDRLRMGAGRLHDILGTYGIASTFETYSGTHTSAVADRFQNHVIPFFDKNLCADTTCR